MTSNFDWTQFEAVEEEPRIEEAPGTDAFDWAQFEEVADAELPEEKIATEPVLEKLAKEREVKEERAKAFKFLGMTPDEETIEKIRKPIGMGLKSFTQGLLGTPGDILETLHTFMGKGETPKGLPTSERIGELFEKFSREEFKPETASEEIISRTTGGLGSIIGLGGPLKAATRGGALGRNLLAAFVPAGVSYASEKLDASPGTQAALTVGSSILAHRLTGKSLRQMEKGMFKQADKLAEGKSIDVRPQAEKLRNMKERVGKSLKTSPSRRFIEDQIDAVLEKYDRNVIPVDEWQAIRRSLNEVAPEARQLKGGKQLLGGVKNIVEESIGHFEKTNPEWSRLFRSANSLHKGMNEARSIERFIKKNPFLSAKGGYLLSLLKLPAAGAYPVLKAGTLTKAFLKNKGLRDAYKDVFKSAAKNEMKATEQALDRFNRQIKKEKINIKD